MEEFFGFMKRVCTSVNFSVKGYVHVRENVEEMWWMCESLGSVIIMSEVSNKVV